MRQETPGLNRFLQRVRRAWTAVGEVAAVSLVAGIVFAAVHPPMLTSTAQVVLPQSVQNAQATQSGQVSNTSVSTGYVATQVVIASSNPVLAAALPHVGSPMSLDKLRKSIEVTSPTSYIVAISAHGKHASDAEQAANAVANSYISYVSSAGSPVGRVQAHLLESATSATGRSLPVSLLIIGGFSALYGAVVGVIGALAFGWAGRRFRISR